MNVAELKEHVTYFSEELKTKGFHREEVVVGGVIRAVVPAVSDDGSDAYIVTVDDHVGLLYVFVSDAMMSAYKDRITIGSSVLFEGLVNVLSRQGKRDVSVFAYGLKDINKEEVHS